MSRLKVEVNINGGTEPTVVEKPGMTCGSEFERLIGPEIAGSPRKLFRSRLDEYHRG